MPTIYIRMAGPVSPPIHVGPDGVETTFSLRAKQWPGTIVMTLSADGAHLFGESNREVAAAQLDCLAAWDLERVFRHADAPEVAETLLAITDAKRYLLALIDQELAYLEIHEVYAGPTDWSRDGITWQPFPHTGISAHVSVSALNRMTPDRALAIQALIDANESAMIAYNQLQHASRIHPNDASWIIATVAAEIAIKETIALMEPALEVLLEELPSPPIHMLYGKILKHLSGESSPFVKQLQEGAARRNRLVHRASRSTPTTSERDTYVRTVASALAHLVSTRRRHAAQNDSRSGRSGVGA